MKRLWFLVFIIGLLVGVSATVKALWPQPFIPGPIKKQVTSTIFMPSGSQVQNKEGTVKYDSKLKLLSYQSSAFGVNTTVSEQPTPDSFNDIPAVYQKVLDSWKEYASFGNSNGTVYLTRPGEQNGKEVGVLNSKGTLMFIKADKDLSGDQWKQLFNNLDIIK
jgi:hypothetical protein